MSSSHFALLNLSLDHRLMALELGSWCASKGSHLESRISSALLGSRIFQALLPGVKDLLDFAGIEGVLSLVGIKDLLSFVGIKDLPGFASWSQGSPKLC
nr:hypothetical protein CFP56_07241 [Quercus suber]